MANKNGSTSVSAPAAVAASAGTVQSAIGSVSARLSEIDTQMASLTAERAGILADVRAIGGTVEAVPASAPSRRGRPAGSRNKPKAGAKAGAKPRAKATRGTNARSLNDKTLSVHIAEVLNSASEPMSPTQICEAVVKNGYKTESPNFSTMVGGQLLNLSRLRFGKGFVAHNPSHGSWTAGSKTAMAAFLADPTGGTPTDGDGKVIE